MKKKLLCIVGPTATGKTDLGIYLAKELDGELIACDSRQVYKGLDIGTGKMPGADVSVEKYDRVWIVDGVPIWLYDIVSPQKQYDVWQYVQDSQDVIKQITTEKKLPILVGGTGLYMRGLLEGFDQMSVPIDLNLREELESLSLTEVQQRLANLDLNYFQSLNNSELHNKRRLIRKIEIELLQEQAQDGRFSEGISHQFDILKIGISVPREVLYQRIDERVLKRVSQGMIDEGRHIHAVEGISFNRMRQLGLEYGLMADFLEGVIPSEEVFIEQLQFRIHQYAKRQLTWFQSDLEIEWFHLQDEDFLEKVASRVRGWYND